MSKGEHDEEYCPQTKHFGAELEQVTLLGITERHHIWVNAEPAELCMVQVQLLWCPISRVPLYRDPHPAALMIQETGA